MEVTVGEWSEEFEVVKVEEVEKVGEAEEADIGVAVAAVAVEEKASEEALDLSLKRERQKPRLVDKPIMVPLVEKQVEIHGDDVLEIDLEVEEVEEMEGRRPRMGRSTRATCYNWNGSCARSQNCRDAAATADLDKPSRECISVIRNTKNHEILNDQHYRPKTTCTCRDEHLRYDPEKYRSCFTRPHSVNSSLSRNEIDLSRSPPIRETIELFDKPNIIETSLPRYQKNCSSKSEEGTINIQKARKLKEFFENNLEADGKSNSKKIEKERHNCILKCNDRDVTTLVWKGNYHLPGSKNANGNVDKKKILMEEMKSVHLSPASSRKFNGFEIPKKKFSFSENTLMQKNKCEISVISSSSQVYGGGWDCHRCGRRVYHAERMLACGNAYHSFCFSCAACRKLLGPRTYLEANMEIYCNQCHAKHFKLTGYGYGMGPGVLQTS